MLDIGNDNQPCVRHDLRNPGVQSWAASAVILSGHDECRCGNLAQPGKHFGLGIDPKHLHENVGVSFNDLPEPALNDRTIARNEAVGEPAIGQGAEYGFNTLLFHGFDYASDGSSVIPGSACCRRQEAERQDPVRMQPGVGRNNHPSERMPGEMTALESTPLPDAFKISNQFFEASERSARAVRNSMAPKIVCYHREMLAQRRQDESPRITCSPDSMDEEKRRATSRHRVFALDRADIVRQTGILMTSCNFHSLRHRFVALIPSGRSESDQSGLKVSSRPKTMEFVLK